MFSLYINRIREILTEIDTRDKNELRSSDNIDDGYLIYTLFNSDRYNQIINGIKSYKKAVSSNQFPERIILEVDLCIEKLELNKNAIDRAREIHTSARYYAITNLKTAIGCLENARSIYDEMWNCKPLICVYTEQMQKICSTIRSNLSTIFTPSIKQEIIDDISDVQMKMRQWAKDRAGCKDFMDSQDHSIKNIVTSFIKYGNTENDASKFADDLESIARAIKATCSSFR